MVNRLTAEALSSASRRTIDEEFNMKKFLLTLAALFVIAGTTSANAHDSFGFGIPLGAPSYYVGPPVVYGPPPAYYSPPPVVYYEPPPVVYFQPAPLYYRSDGSL